MTVGKEIILAQDQYYLEIISAMGAHPPQPHNLEIQKSLLFIN